MPEGMMAQANPLNEVESKTLIDEAAAVEEGAEIALAAAEDYWTEGRMADAQPIGFDIDGSIEALAAALPEAQFEPEGDREEREAVPPDGGAPFALQGGAIDLATYNTRRVSNRNVLPYCAVGKMFMRFDGVNYVGTGWTIAERAVFTAGHCIFDRGGRDWADTILFVPQYHQGAEPKGRWAATRLHSLRGWTQNQDFKYDMGVFEVDRPVRPATGSLGWMANFPPNQGPYTSIGYPAGTPFDGQEMWQSVGAYIGGSNPIEMHNDMTPGCSGGPWVTPRAGGPFANGLNSFRWNNSPNTMFSPYFGQGFLNLFDLVK